MAKTSALSKITAEAKRIRKRHPHKYDRKKNSWSAGYMVEAAAKYRRNGLKRKKPKKKVSGVAKKKPRPRKKKASTRGLRLVKNVKKTTTEQVMAGKRRRHRPRSKVGTVQRRRSVGARGGNTGMLLAVGIGAVALLLLSQRQPTYPGGYQNLPPIQQTGNVTRDQKSWDIVQYAMAAGVAVDAISKLIDLLNKSDDNKVDNIYDHVNTTGDVGAWV